MIHTFKGITPYLAEGVFVVESAEIIGDVRIGEMSSLWFNVVVRGDVNHIRIGKRTNIQDGTVVHVTHKKHPTIVGDDVTIGHNVTLHGCRIGDRCLIGMGAVVMDGVEIGNDVLIAAGSLVTPGTRIPDGTLFAGAPARLKRELKESEILDLKHSAEHYLAYVQEYRS